VPPLYIIGALYDNASDKSPPRIPMVANRLVVRCAANNFARKLEVETQLENSEELEPNRDATLDDEVPKLEPNSVRRTHPVVGALVTLTDEEGGGATDTLKMLEPH